ILKSHHQNYYKWQEPWRLPLGAQRPVSPERLGTRLQKRAVVLDLRRERDRERSILETYASRTAPELLECERGLQCCVEGIEKDKVLLRFTHIDKGNLDREFSVVIDVSSSVYKVPTTSPALPTLPILLDELNKSRDVYASIKQVRQAFEHLVMQGR
ncbi:chromosome segregation protein Spc25-domain-containing protein, partial [Cytidiella melzeri]